ncbi:hypothetical protein [Streptomyces mirabilis]|uniref:Uncharacterized protein n=1 Tax=Streptomyces mirabilis TaxID=68239 RepID=A0ABU3UWA3_9ACTN|nr:hypothetical protein [Streptomyces mirabilis]MDU8998216.1 hypothetical protein [Streptomyces mirabilis]
MTEPKTREDYFAAASHHLAKAVHLAGYAEDLAHTPNNRHKSSDYAAAGALHADIARSAAAIAQALPEDTIEIPEI